MTDKRPRITVSTDGLTRCPSCKSHITLDREQPNQTTCPFCDAELGPALRRASSARSAWMRLGTKGALIAGALVGATVLAGCPEDNEDNNEADMSAVEDMASPKVDMAVNNTPVPEYGLPAPEDMGTEPDIDMAANNIPAPEYGLPATEDMGAQD